MATPAQTQVTLDASQFIASVDEIGKAITDMNKNLASAGTAFQAFAASTVNIEKTLLDVVSAQVATKQATEGTTKAVRDLIAAQNQQTTILAAVSGATQRAATSLEALNQASAATGKAGVRDAKAFTFAWDGIFRLLTVTVIRRVFLDIAGAMGNSISAAAEYQENIGRIVALHQNLGVTTDELTAKFNNLALAYGRSLKDTADIGKIATGEGGAQTSEQIDAITNSSIRLAEVTGSTGPAAATAITAVTRAFQLTAEESQNVSNQLIHLSQSGIGMEAINGSIGRVSAQAQRLGVSFSEMGLLMETLKKTGISDAEVMTQLGAVFNTLERPTQRMRELMAGNGIFSPQQLIQAQRLHGALLLIKQDVSDENIQANQAVQGRRAGGGLAVADEFAARSRNNPLNDIQGLDDTANSALKIVDATGRWNDELEKIRTIFIGEIGPQIIKVILEISDRAGGLAKAITDSGRYIALILEPIALVVGGAVILGQRIERLAEVFGVLNSSTRLNRDSMSAFGEAAREAMERTNTWIAAQRQISRQSLQDGTQAIANTFTPVNAALTRQAEVQRERVHTLGEEIEASSKSIFGAFASQIEVLESVTRQAESRIMESLKRVQEFGDKTTRDAFEHRLKSAGEVSQTSPFTSANQQNNAAKLLVAQDNAAINQLNLIRDRRQRLTEEIAQMQARGDANSIESARRRFVELRQLNDQENDIRASSARRNAEFTSRATGSDQTFNPFNREREAGARRLNAAEEAFEAANRRRLAAQQAALEQINRRLREQVQLVQEGQRNIARLPNQLLGTDGRPRDNFQGTSGGAAATVQINTTIDQQIERIRQLPATIEQGIADALRRGLITSDQAEQARRRAPTPQEVQALTLQLESQRIATQSLFQTAEARRVSEANQREQISILQAIARNTDNSLKEAAEARQGQVNLLRASQEQINGLRTSLPTQLVEDVHNGVESGNNLRRLIARLNEADVAVARATSGRPADVTAAAQAVDAVRRAASEFQEGRGQRGIPQPGIIQLEETMRRLDETIAQRNRAEAALATAQQVQQTSTQGLGAAGFINQTNSAINTGISSIVNGVNTVPTVLADLAEAIRRGTASIESIIPPPRQIPPPQIINGGFASGGLIGNSFSSFGPDNLTIRARRGEFVMNPDATREFYPTLVRMNRGDSPRGGGYSHGGTVTNSSIGNMTFNVNGSDSPEQTARAVMKIIRREQRRGNA